MMVATLVGLGAVLLAYLAARARQRRAARRLEEYRRHAIECGDGRWN